MPSWKQRHRVVISKALSSRSPRLKKRALGQKEMNRYRVSEDIKRRRQEGMAMALRLVHVNRGTLYPCTQATLEKTQRHCRKNRTRFVDNAELVSEAIAINQKPSRARQAASRRILNAITQPTEEWQGDLIIKMFADLDVVFFDGCLLGNVCVKWVPSKYSGGHSCWGVTTPERANNRQCTIELSAEMIFLRPTCTTPGKQIWATILHEMCQ